MIRNRIYDLFFLTFLLSVLYGVSQLLAPFSGALLSALVCAIMFYPWYEALRRWFPRQPPAVMALVADILVLVVFVTPMILLTWAVVQESSYLGPAMVRWNITLAEWRRGVTGSVPGMGHLQRGLGSIIGMTPLQFQGNVIERVGLMLEMISGWGQYAADRALFFLFDLLGIFFTLFFLFRDGDRWFDYVHDLVPMNRSDKEHLMARIHDTVIGVSRGWLLTSLVQGVTAMLIYIAVGLEGAVLLGALTAFFGLVPGVGTVAIWAPAAIFLLAKGLYWRSAFVLLWGAFIVVGLIDTVMRPYLIGKRVELPLFILFFALLGGVAVWGAKGIIIGPILVAITPVLADIYRDRYLRGPEGKPNGLAPGVKTAVLLSVLMSFGMAPTLWADALIRHEKKLEQMQADRRLDNEHTLKAKEEFRKGTAELSGDDEQQLKNVQQLRSVEKKIAIGQDQKTVTHQSYKEALQKYGSTDPRSVAAKASWKESGQTLDPLLENRQSLRQDVYQGRLLVHNDQTVLSVQKRDMYSDAQYRASDDRKIRKVEKTIADDKRTAAPNVPSTELATAEKP